MKHFTTLQPAEWIEAFHVAAEAAEMSLSQWAGEHLLLAAGRADLLGGRRRRARPQTEVDAAGILAARAEGASLRDLAERFGVGVKVIRRVLRGFSCNRE